MVVGAVQERMTLPVPEVILPETPPPQPENAAKEEIKNNRDIVTQNDAEGVNLFISGVFLSAEY